MTITSYGYDGTVDEVPWARMMRLFGTSYAVWDAGDLSPSIGGGGDRSLTLASGTASGHGVMDDFSTSTVVTADAVSSGSRWDTVVVHRDWSGTGGTTTVRINKGTSLKSVLLTDQDPGVLDDQPILLIRCASGQAAVQEVIDLRVMPSKILALMQGAAAPLLAPAMDQTGARFWGMDDDVEYAWITQPVGGGGVVQSLLNLDDPAYTTWTTSNGLASGVFIPNDTALQFGAARGWGYLRGSVKRNGGNVINAGDADAIIGTLPAPYRPQGVRRFQCPAGQPTGSGAWNQTVGVSVFSTGQVKVAAAEKDVPWVAMDGLRWWLGD